MVLSALEMGGGMYVVQGALRRNRWLPWAATVMLSGVPACKCARSGGDGAGVGPEPAETASAESVARFQLTQLGATCRYRATSFEDEGPGQPRVAALEVRRRETFAGKAVTVLAYRSVPGSDAAAVPIPSFEVLQAIDPSRSATVGFVARPGDAPTPVEPPYVDLQGPVRTGTSWTFDADTLSWEDAEGRPFRCRHEVRIEEAGIDITVPGGSFHDCARAMMRGSRPMPWSPALFTPRRCGSEAARSAPICTSGMHLVDRAARAA